MALARTAQKIRELFTFQFIEADASGPVPVLVHAREKSPRHPGNEAAGVSPVRHARHDSWEPADNKPDEHHRDRLWMQIEAGCGIELALHPDVTQQAVNDARHPAEGGTLKIKLS